MPDVQPDDIVLFGSYYAINPVIRRQMTAFLEHARSNGAILYYDVNFRPSHEGELIRVMPNILENLEMADIVRGSDEDFHVMFRKAVPTLSISRRFHSIAAGLSIRAAPCRWR